MAKLRHTEPGAGRLRSEDRHACNIPLCGGTAYPTGALSALPCCPHTLERLRNVRTLRYHSAR